MINKIGYYWVKETENSEWKIAEWDGFSSFWFCGSDTEAEPHQLFEIDLNEIKHNEINYNKKHLESAFYCGLSCGSDFDDDPVKMLNNFIKTIK